MVKRSLENGGLAVPGKSQWIAAKMIRINGIAD